MTQKQNILKTFLAAVFCLMVFAMAGEAEATLLWDGSFQSSWKRTGTNSAYTNGVYQTACLPQPDSFVVVPAPNGRPGYAGKFTVRAGSAYNCATNQHDVIGVEWKNVPNPYNDVWLGYSIMLDPSWLPSGGGPVYQTGISGLGAADRFISQGLSGTGISFGPSFRTWDGKVYLGNNIIADTSMTYTYKKGKWTDFLLHVKLTQTKTGFVEVYIREEGETDYRLLHQKRDIQTVPTNSFNPFWYGTRAGIYRSDDSTSTQIIYVYIPKLGTTRADVEYSGVSIPPPAHCSNEVQDSDETGIDCGGADCPACVTPPVPDTTAPVIDITCPQDGATYTSPVTSVSGTVTDAGGMGTVRVKVGPAGAWQNAAVTGSSWVINNLTGIVAGLNTIYAQATDAAGNVSPENGEFIQVSYDSTGPPPGNLPPTCIATPPVLCGNGVKDIGEFCEKTTNEGCSAPSICNSDCAACVAPPPPPPICYGVICNTPGYCQKGLGRCIEVNGDPVCTYFYDSKPCEDNDGDPCKMGRCSSSDGGITGFCDKAKADVVCNTPGLCQAGIGECVATSLTSYACSYNDDPDPCDLDDDECTLDVCKSSDGNFSSSCVATNLDACEGIVPCGRMIDNPKTHWNETAPCEFCHLVLILNRVMNFLMELAAVVSLLAIIITGLLFIVSASNPEIKNKAKASLKWIIIGLIIIFLAWLLIDFLLSAWGYLDPLGGKWNVIC